MALIVWGWSRNFTEINFNDYLSYWAAGKLALEGEPAAAYDAARHRAIEATVAQMGGFLPFPYPPQFLLLIAPFGLLPYIWSFAAWVMATLAVYVLVIRRTTDTFTALAHPAVLQNGLIGQNGFLTAAIFASGTTMLRTRPIAAGTILGVLVIKPQLALLLPIAVVAGRLWRAIVGALATVTALTLLALILFGTDVFTGFIGMLDLYSHMMRRDSWPWAEFISVFAFVRWFGVDQFVALTVHTLVAVLVAFLTWIAWSRDWKEQVPVLAAATLLIPPYLLTYDGLLLIIPISYWLRQEQRPFLVVLSWSLCFFPIAYFFHLYRGPNTVPLAALLFLCATVWGRLRRHRPFKANMNHAHLV
jgi:hypothetical protein